MTSNHENPNKKQRPQSRQAAEAAFNQSLEQLRELLEQRQQEADVAPPSEDKEGESKGFTAEDWDSVEDDLNNFFGDEDDLD
jgi:hypothetical protein